MEAMPALAEAAGRGLGVPLEPVLPATTLPVQATLTTGEPPARHGIVANGLFFHDTAEVRFWEQSWRLAGAPRAWTVEGRRPLRVASLFWQLAMYDPSIDILLTPKPIHAPGDRLLADVYSKPAGLYARLAETMGPFDLRSYWGPAAGLDSSRWIAEATCRVWKNEAPDLLLAYLPHLDYSGHRAGPDSAAHRDAARELDGLLAPLLEIARAGGDRVLVLSEYAFVNVTRPVAPNRLLREAGLLEPREVEGGEYLYPGDVRAFALVDNQVAHIHFPATPDLPSDLRRAKRVLAAAEGVERVLDRAAQAEAGIDHVRSGELVLVAEPDAHFTYYWWTDEERAPAFAPTVDIHAKPGFDAAELFLDPATKAVPLSAEAVRGSHGRTDTGQGVYVDTAPPRSLAGRRAVGAIEVAHRMLA